MDTVGCNLLIRENDCEEKRDIASEVTFSSNSPFQISDGLQIVQELISDIRNHQSHEFYFKVEYQNQKVYYSDKKTFVIGCPSADLMIISNNPLNILSVDLRVGDPERSIYTIYEPIKDRQYCNLISNSIENIVTLPLNS